MPELKFESKLLRYEVSVGWSNQWLEDYPHGPLKFTDFDRAYTTAIEWKTKYGRQPTILEIREVQL